MYHEDIINKVANIDFYENLSLSDLIIFVISFLAGIGFAPTFFITIPIGPSGPASPLILPCFASLPIISPWNAGNVLNCISPPLKNIYPSLDLK